MKKKLYAMMRLAILLVSLLLFHGCRTKYVSVPEYHERYVVKSDTLRLSDSIYVKDSVFVCRNGDTVTINKILYRDRYRNVYKTKIDTVLVRDSIRVLIPTNSNTEKSSKWKDVYLKISKAFFLVLCMPIGLGILYRFAKRRGKNA